MKAWCYTEFGGLLDVDRVIDDIKRIAGGLNDLELRSLHRVAERLVARSTPATRELSDGLLDAIEADLGTANAGTASAHTCFVVEVIYEDGDWNEARCVLAAVKSLDEAKTFADAYVRNVHAHKESCHTIGHALGITSMSPTPGENWRRPWRDRRGPGSIDAAFDTWRSSQWLLHTESV